MIFCQRDAGAGKHVKPAGIASSTCCCICPQVCHVSPSFGWICTWEFGLVLDCSEAREICGKCTVIHSIGAITVPAAIRQRNKPILLPSGSRNYSEHVGTCLACLARQQALS